MKNIRIIFERKDYIIVVADSERFGKNEVMYEGNCFRECLDYVKRETGKETLRITGCISSLVEDWKGDLFPHFMGIS